MYGVIHMEISERNAFFRTTFSKMSPPDFTYIGLEKSYIFNFHPSSHNHLEPHHDYFTYIHRTKSKGCHKLILVLWRGIFLDAIFSPREDSPSIINQVRDDERWWSTGGFISCCFPWNFLPVSPIKGFWQPTLLCCTIHQPVHLHLSLQNHVTRL